MTHDEEQKRRLQDQSPQGADSENAGSGAAGKAELRWPFPAGSQNNTDSAVKLKPYVPPKCRGLNQY